MRASYVALIVAVLAIPSAAHSQDNGLVGGRVGSDLSTSSTPPTNGLQGGAYRRPSDQVPAPAPQGWSCPARLFPNLCLSSQDRTAVATRLLPAST